MRFGKKGFTLLELMLSLAIMGLVLLIIFGALRVGTRAWEKGEKEKSFVMGTLKAVEKEKGS